MRMLREVALPIFITCAVLLGGAAVVRLATAEPTKVIHVRWRPTVDETARVAFEAELLLANGERTEGNTYAYEVLDPRTKSIRAIVRHPAIEDTHEIDREAFQLQPSAPDGRSQRWLADDLPLLRDDRARTAMMYLLLTLLALSGGAWLLTRAKPPVYTEQRNTDSLMGSNPTVQSIQRLADPLETGAKGREFEQMDAQPK